MGIYDNAMASRDAAYFKREDAAWDKMDAINKQAEELVNLFGEGKDLWLAGIKYNPQNIVELLIEKGVDCSNLLILMFSKDDAARSAAYNELIDVFEEIADEQLEYEAEERRNDF